MSANTAQPQKSPGDPCARVRHYRAQLFELRQKSVRKQKVYQRAGIALTGILVVYLSVLTGKLFQLDAHAITEFGRLEVQKQIPGGAESLRSHLKAQAPFLIARVLQSILESVPTLRESVTKDFLAKNSVIMEQFEEQMTDIAAEAIRAGREKLDSMEGDSSDLEKFDLLTKAVLAEVRKEVSAAFLALQPQYTAELQRVQDYLKELQHKSEEELTERQKVHKELILTVIQLVMRHELEEAKRKSSQ